MFFDKNAFVAFCEKCADTVKGLKDRCYESAVAGGPDSMLPTIGYFSERENVYRYEIPNMLDSFISQHETSAPVPSGITVINSRRVRELWSEDTAVIAVSTESGQRVVTLIAELENNENTDEEDYTPSRVNEYFWVIDTSSGLNLADEINHQRETHAGGIGIYNTDNPFGALEAYATANPTYLEFPKHQTVGIFECLADGFYIVVYGNPQTLYR